MFEKETNHVSTPSSATLTDTLGSFFSQPLILAGISAWFLAQFIKALVAILKYNHRLGKGLLVTFFWSTGGMPSSHSAVVTAVTTVVGFQEGITDPLFGVSLFFSFLAIRDALGVRRAAGLQARVLNQIISDLNQKHGTAYKHVKEINGHKAAEVVVGVLLGLVLGIAFANL